MVRSLVNPGRLLRAGWFVLAVAMVIVIGFWAFRIGGALTSHGHEALPSPPPVKSIPTVVTEGPDSASLTPAQLCAELAPGTNEVLVEDSLGIVVSSLQC